jgi:hypothetical protein
VAKASEDAVLLAAVYDDVDAALADLDGFEQSHEAEMIGSYDAAVIEQEHGEPRIVKRADRRRVRVIPEWLGTGSLARRQLHDAARSLDEGEAALIVVGEPTLAKGFEKAVTRAATTTKHDLNAAVDELASELSEEVVAK